jgi:hypothetical protein
VVTTIQLSTEHHPFRLPDPELLVSRLYDRSSSMGHDDVLRVFRRCPGRNGKFLRVKPSASTTVAEQMIVSTGT